LVNQSVIVYMEWWCARETGIRSAGTRECGIDWPGAPPATLVAIVAAAALSAAKGNLSGCIRDLGAWDGT
jgi:hypothetical protein